MPYFKSPGVTIGDTITRPGLTGEVASIEHCPETGVLHVAIAVDPETWILVPLALILNPVSFHSGNS